jgi:DNA polymerase IIIc chi subunit
MTTCTFHDTEAPQQDRRLFEIVEQAFHQREKIVVFAQSDQRASAIDRVLWIHRQEAFIPHEILTTRDPESSVPVAIVTSELNPIGAGTLVADGHCSLDFALSFGVVHEFVNRSSPQIHATCRERFRAYREKQIPVKHLK